MKSFNEITKKQKIISVILLLIIVISFIFAGVELMDEDNYQTEIICEDGTKYIVPGKVSNKNAYCNNNLNIIINGSYEK